MKTINLFTIIFLGYTINSCISFEKLQQQVINDSQHSLEIKDSCCDSLKNIQSKGFEKRKLFTIDRQDSALNFIEGKSFFESFQLTPNDKSYLLTLKSKPYGGKNLFLKKPTFFLPLILLLDKDKNIIAYDFQFKTSKYECQYFLSKTYWIVEELAEKAHFIVIYTDPELVGTNVENSSKMTAYTTGQGMVGFTHNTVAGLALNLEGRLSISTRQPKWLNDD